MNFYAAQHIRAGRLVPVLLPHLSAHLGMHIYYGNRTAQPKRVRAFIDLAIAREAGLPYVYLGYWVPGSRKMGYKAGFDALEIYKAGAWQQIGDPADHRAELHPLSVDPIAEQVARIALPEARPGQAPA